MLPQNILSALSAPHGDPSMGGHMGAPGSSRAAMAALGRAIAALHTYLDLEADPKKRATATQCLARMEALRGDHMNPPPGGPPQTPTPGGAPGMGGY